MKRAIASAAMPAITDGTMILVLFFDDVEVEIDVGFAVGGLSDRVLVVTV